MYGLDNNSGINAMPAVAPTVSPTPLWFTDGGANQPPSYPGQDWFNIITAELLNVLAEAAIAPNKADSTQLSTAIKKIIANSANVVPVGVPLPWPTATAPQGWLKCNGAAFSKTQYPQLAVAYPSGVLPDLRGEFLRGWDDGRGSDAGRALLSAQSHAMQRMTGSVNAVHAQTVGATFVSSGVLGMSRVDSTTPPPGGGANYGGFGISFDNNVSGINTSTENRPRNIAFNYIVRAA